MDRILLALSTAIFLANLVQVLAQMKDGRHLVRRRSLVMMAAGFALTTWALWLRGETLGRCPITNLGEVLVFLAWGVTGWYFILGPAYRLSLLGMFTSALVALLQGIAILPGVFHAPSDTPRATPPNPWLELHGSLSLLAYAAFAAAALAGLMFLIQDSGLKNRKSQGVFFHLPPINHLFQAMMLVLTFGGVLLICGMIAGYLTPGATSGPKHLVSWVVLAIYGTVIVLRWTGWSHRQVALGAVAGFLAAVLSLWLMS